MNAEGEAVQSLLAVIERSFGSSLFSPTPVWATAVCPTEPLCTGGPAWTGISSAHACCQQQTYLRLGVLLI